MNFKRITASGSNKYDRKAGDGANVALGKGGGHDAFDN